MGRTATDIAVIALVVIALAQVVVAAVIAAASLRLLREIHTLQIRLEKTLGELEVALERIAGLASQASGAVQGAQRLAAQAATLAGVGRTLAESMVGRALLRRVAPRLVQGATDAASGGTSTAAKVAIDLGLHVWHILAAHRARRRMAEAAAAAAATEPTGPPPGSQVVSASRRGAPAPEDHAAASGPRHSPGVGRVRRLEPVTRSAQQQRATAPGMAPAGPNATPDQEQRANGPPSTGPGDMPPVGPASPPTP